MWTGTNVCSHWQELRCSPLRRTFFSNLTSLFLPRSWPGHLWDQRGPAFHPPEGGSRGWREGRGGGERAEETGDAVAVSERHWELCPAGGESHRCHQHHALLEDYLGYKHTSSYLHPHYHTFITCTVNISPQWLHACILRQCNVGYWGMNVCVSGPGGGAVLCDSMWVQCGELSDWREEDATSGLVYWRCH